MATRVESLRKELQASEASLQAYREQEQIVDVTGLKALPAAEISNLSARLLEVRQTLAARRLLPAGHAGGWTRGNLLGVPALLADEACAAAQAARRLHNRRWRSSEKRYGLSHPKNGRCPKTNSPRPPRISTTRPAASLKASGNATRAAKSEEAAIVAALNRAGQQYKQVAARSRSSRACSGPWTRIARSTTSF